MHPILQVSGQLVGVVLILLAVAWFFGWRRSADERERQMAPFGGVLGLAGVVLLTGVAGTITWPTYGFFMGCGCLALTVVTVYWARKRQIMSVDQVLEMLLLTGICGLIGARAVFLVETWDEHFADQPATVFVGQIKEAMEPGDTLRLASNGAPAFEVTFQGGEASFAALEAPLAAAGALNDFETQILTTQHRGNEQIEVTPRALLLRTKRRGPEASLRVSGGSATSKLSIGYADGVAVPWTKIFDLRGGGLTYFGSVIGVLLSAAIYLRRRKISLIKTLDLVAPGLPLGLFFGRLGCLSYGCCWGRVAGENALYTLSFPRWSPAWGQFAAEQLPSTFDHLLADKTADPAVLTKLLGPLADGTPPLHATQLYEGLTVLLIAVIVFAYRAWLQRRVGQAFALVVVLQAPTRFVVEHFRRDHEVFFTLAGYPFTESQLVAVLMLALGVPGLIYLSLRGEPLEALPRSAASPKDAPATPTFGAPAPEPREAAPSDPEGPAPSEPEGPAPDAA